MLLGPGSLNGESDENSLRLQMAMGERTIPADVVPERCCLHRFAVALMDCAALCLAIFISSITRVAVATTKYRERYVRSRRRKRTVEM